MELCVPPLDLQRPSALSCGLHDRVALSETRA